MVGKGRRSGVLCTSYFLSLKHRLERPLKLFFNMKSVSHWPRFLSHSTLFIYETIGISGFPYRKFIKSSFVLTSYGLWRFWWLPLGHKSCHYLYIPSATMHFMDICVPALSPGSALLVPKACSSFLSDWTGLASRARALPLKRPLAALV